MYNEYRNPLRANWEYRYKGSDLLSGAQAKLKELQSEVSRLRNQCADVMRDTTSPFNSEEMKKTRERIERVANEVEQCEVFVHEFSRMPGREYVLGLGDVVYFGLIEESVPQGVDN